MYSNKSLILFFIGSALAVCAAQFQYDEMELEGACPRVRFITNFEMSRIIGWYYRAFSNFDNPFCFNNDAQTMFAAQINATSINVAFCCRSAADPTVATCGTDIGSGVISAETIAGAFSFTTKNGVYPSFILDTDYDNFTIVYGCRAGTSADQRDEYIYIYSRSYTLSLALQDRARRVLQRNNIQWSDAKRVAQGPDMPYLPLPKQCRSVL